jgi:hypothetical protein
VKGVVFLLVGPLDVGLLCFLSSLVLFQSAEDIALQLVLFSVDLEYFLGSGVKVGTVSVDFHLILHSLHLHLVLAVEFAVVFFIELFAEFIGLES